MDDIVSFLRSSIEDQFFSKTEKRTLKTMLGERVLDQHQLNFLRGKIHELAGEKATPENYRFILEWVKTSISAIIPPSREASDVFFSPGEACRHAIISQIQGATTQLQICVFTISDDIITNALLSCHKKGVNIRLITDNEKSYDEGSDIAQIAGAGVAVKMDTSPNHMHHKFMLVDQRVVLTGSYNWTRSAARYNHENVLVTKDPGVIKSFSKEFVQLWEEMEEYG